MEKRKEFPTYLTTLPLKTPVLLPTKCGGTVVPGGNTTFLLVLAPQQMQTMLLSMTELHRVFAVRGSTAGRSSVRPMGSCCFAALCWVLVGLGTVAGKNYGDGICNLFNL